MESSHLENFDTEANRFVLTPCRRWRAWGRIDTGVRSRRATMPFAPIAKSESFVGVAE